jgi:hypothetical protein
VVVVRNCIGVSRGRRPKLELIHRSILARTSGHSSNVRGRTPHGDGTDVVGAPERRLTAAFALALTATREAADTDSDT